MNPNSDLVDCSLHSVPVTDGHRQAPPVPPRSAPKDSIVAGLAPHRNVGCKPDDHERVPVHTLVQLAYSLSYLGVAINETVLYPFIPSMVARFGIVSNEGSIGCERHSLAD